MCRATVGMIHCYSYGRATPARQQETRRQSCSNSFTMSRLPLQLFSSTCALTAKSWRIAVSPDRFI